MVDRPLPPDPSEVKDVLAQYGVNADIRTPVQASELDDIAHRYGVKLKGTSEKPSAGRSTKPAATEPVLTTTPSGKVIEQPPTFTEQQIRAGKARGLRAQFTSAIPIAGPALDLAEAAIPGPGKGDTFGQRFYDQKQADEAFANENPLSSAGANIAGSLVGYGGLAKGAPALLGLESRLLGSSLGARAYGGMFGGAAVNALDAGMRGDNPITGAEVGAAGGLAGPLLSGGAGAIVNTAANTLWPRPGPLKAIPRSGINILANALEGETPATLAAGKTRMGPAGFFADLTPGLTDVAGAIADTPGQGKALVRQAYADRADQQGNRIEGALTRAMGPRVNVVDQNKYLTEERAKAADPLYEAFRTMQVHPTAEIKALIPRLEKSGAFDMAEHLSGISGRPIDRNFFTGGPQKAYPTTEAWDYVKRGLDSKIDQAYSSGDKTTARELLKLKGEMITEVEKTPAGKIWQRARSEFADRSALIDQLAMGRDTFVGGRSGTTVDEFRDELKHLRGPELMSRIQGARDIASEAMGASKNGDTTLRNKLLAPNNQEKLRLLLGQKDGEALIKTLKEEEYLGNQTSNVLGNMQTGASGSMRTERRKMFDPPVFTGYDPNLTKPLTLIPEHLRPHNVLQSIAHERSGRVAPSIAPLMVTPQGPQMDDIVNALKSEADRVSSVNRLAAPWINSAGAVVSGPGQAFYRRYYERNSGTPK